MWATDWSTGKSEHIKNIVVSPPPCPQEVTQKRHALLHAPPLTLAIPWSKHPLSDCKLQPGAEPEPGGGQTLFVEWLNEVRGWVAAGTDASGPLPVCEFMTPRRNWGRRGHEW